jgi:phage-related protein
VSQDSRFLAVQTSSAVLAAPDVPDDNEVDDIYVIDRMSEEIPGQVTYELAPAWDVEGVQLPRRQILANHCPWVYKADPCTWGTKGIATVSPTTGTKVSGTVASFNATVSPTTRMNVTSVTSGTLRAGMSVTGTFVYSFTKISALGTGTGGVGTYTLNKAQLLTASPSTGTSVGTYENVPQKITTGSGTGVTFKVVIAAASTAYTTTATVTVMNPGKDYAITDTITIDGASIGGVSTTNDMILEIKSLANQTYYDQNDDIVASQSSDRCGKRLNSCRLRFGTRALPYGGFPSAGLYGKPI